MPTLMNSGSPRIEWMCRYCGQRRVMFKNNGRPIPGECPRRERKQPHSWIKNRDVK